MPSGFVKAAEASEIGPGEMKVVDVNGLRILIVNVEGNYHAMDESCTHAFAPLSEGDLDGEELECPLHGGSFNAKTGEVINGPPNEPLTTYQVKIEGDDILVGPQK